MRLLANASGRFQLLAWGEGASFLVLLGIAMPLKYLANWPLGVRVVGMAHGVLFVLYLLAVMEGLASEGWTLRKAAVAVVASFLPFGTFWFTARHPAEPPR